MCFIKRLFHKCSGVVATETVLTLPIYLVLLGAGAWLSEVATGRDVLAVASQEHIWMLGCRSTGGNTVESLTQHVSTTLGNSHFNVSAVSHYPIPGETWWWHEDIVSNTLTMTQPTMIRNLVNLAKSSSSSTVTLASPTYVRRTRDEQSPWRRYAEYGNILCGADNCNPWQSVQSILLEPSPCYTGNYEERGWVSLPFTPVQWYTSNAKTYKNCLY